MVSDTKAASNTIHWRDQARDRNPCYYRVRVRNCACKRVRRRIFRLGETWCTASRPAWADIASIGSSLMRHEIKSRYAELTTERNKNVHRKWFCRSRVDKRSYDEISASARDTSANVSRLAFLRWTKETPTSTGYRLEIRGIGLNNSRIRTR